MKQFCFICGNPSHDFERKAKVAIVMHTNARPERK